MADNNKEVVKTKEKAKKPRRNWFKETFSELKKVSWPTVPTVVKQTGTVLLVVAIFLVVLFLFDLLLSFLYKKLFSVQEAVAFIGEIKSVLPALSLKLGTVPLWVGL